MAKNKLQLLQNLIEIPDILILVKNFRKCRSQLADQQIDNAEFLIKGRFLDTVNGRWLHIALYNGIHIIIRLIFLI